MGFRRSTIRLALIMSYWLVNLMFAYFNAASRTHCTVYVHKATTILTTCLGWTGNKKYSFFWFTFIKSFPFFKAFRACLASKFGNVLLWLQKIFSNKKSWCLSKNANVEADLNPVKKLQKVSTEKFIKIKVKEFCFFHLLVLWAKFLSPITFFSNFFK